MSSQLNPYISFQDNAKEAMEFYKTVFGGELVIHKFDEYSMPHDEDENAKVMHAMLTTANGMIFMGADTPKSMQYDPGSRISMSLSGTDDADLSGYFEKLAAGGTVTMPLEKAPWGDKFGMLTDKFGVQWMVNIMPAKA